MSTVKFNENQMTFWWHLNVCVKISLNSDWPRAAVSSSVLLVASTNNTSRRSIGNRPLYLLSVRRVRCVRAHVKKQDSPLHSSQTSSFYFLLQQWIWKTPAALFWQPTTLSRRQGYIWWTRTMQHLSLQDMLFSAGKLVSETSQLTWVIQSFWIVLRRWVCVLPPPIKYHNLQY